MHFQEFFYGVIFAFALILPLGAQNIFVLSQGALSKNKIHLLSVVITASLSDTFLILISVIGISGIILKWSFLLEIILLVGIIFIIYLAITSFFKKPESDINLNEQTDNNKATKLIFVTLLLSLLNPYALLDTIGTIGVFASSYTNLGAKIAFSAGCILTSWLWFFFLGFVVGKNINRISYLRKYQNQISGLIMFIIAIILSIKLITMVFK